MARPLELAQPSDDRPALGLEPLRAVLWCFRRPGQPGNDLSCDTIESPVTWDGIAQFAIV